MNIAGIVCEYNPFHRGHSALMAETKNKIGTDTGVLCVMSGNFVQRGEPAVISKHARAKAAVECGADLVLELPLPWATASAERFARGAVGLMEMTGIVTHLAFGSECGEVGPLREIANTLSDDRVDSAIRAQLELGVSYPRARQTAVETVMGDCAGLLREPNNILGIEYLKALDKLDSQIQPVTIKRILVAHDGKAQGHMAPASAIRELMYSGGDFEQYIPPEAYRLIAGEIDAGRGPVDIRLFQRLVMFRLRTMAEGEFRALPDCGEGLWMRVMRLGRSCGDYSTLLLELKTKRYAMSRIRRILLSALLGVKAEDSEGIPPYIRVLALNERGREMLREIKRRTQLPIITKPAAAKALTGRARELFELEARSTDIYSLLYKDEAARQGGQEWTQGPVIVREK